MKRIIYGQLIVVLLLLLVPVESTQAQFQQIQWEEVAPQPYSNAEGQSVVVNDMLYSFGGFDSTRPGWVPTSRVYRYDVHADTWTRLSDMPNGGTTHSGITTDGEDIYYAGGYIMNASQTGQIFGTREVWRYNVADDTYTRMPDLPVESSAGQLAYLNGKLHHIGGSNLARTQDVGDHFVLDIANNATAWTTAAPLPNPRHHMGVAVLNGLIYIVGGQHDHDGNLTPQDDVHVYNPNTDTWQELASMPDARNHTTSTTLVINGQIFVLGGQKYHNSRYSTVFVYDPPTDTWAQWNDMPVRRNSAVGGYVGGYIVFSTGYNDDTYRGLIVDLVPQGTTPTGLIEMTSGNPTYTWTTVEGATEYTLLVANASNQQVFQETIAATNYCDNTQCEIDATTLNAAYNLPEGTYTYYVQAIANGQTSIWSSGTTFTLDITPPGEVTLLDAEGVNTFTPTLRWSLDADTQHATYFHVYLVSQANVNQPIINQWVERDTVCQGDSCAFVSPVNLSNGDTYDLYIASYGTGGTGAYSGPGSFTMAVPVPSAPQNINVTTTDQLAPNITWNDDVDASYFHVYAVLQSNPGTPIINRWVERNNVCQNGTCTFVSPVDLTNGAIYDLYMASYGAGEVSDYTAPHTFTMAVPVPSAPQNVNVTMGEYFPTITWNDDANADYFELVIATGTTVVYQQWHASADVCNGSTCTRTVENLLQNIQHTVYIRAWGEGGYSQGGVNNSGYSFGVNFTPPSYIPALVTGLAASGEDDGNPTLTWTGVERATHYDVWVGTPNSVTFMHETFAAADLGCNPTCTLETQPNLPPGDYNIYVLSIGLYANSPTYAGPGQFTVD